MTKLTTGKIHRGDYKIDKPYSTVPQIEREYTEDGKRFYLTTSGAVYEADTYDRNFKVVPVALKRKGYKGRPVSLDGAGMRIDKKIKRFVNG